MLYSFSKTNLAQTAILIMFAGSIALTNTSCTSNKYAKQATALDSLNRLLHKADSALSSIDTTKIKKYSDHVMTSVELIKMAHKDSMSAGAATIFRNYNALRWEFETFLGKRAVIKTEMHKSMDQLDHLSHDLRNNLIKSDSVAGFYNAETKRANLLLEGERMSIDKLNNQLPLYNLIAPQADSLISLVKNHKDI
ncbi:MAG TPA: hypothetical protein VK890_06665 [Bacteroidia bacterium]|jgi:hypothetical protein|nr:hypothetical protein [Bacteroidia bacterium]